MLIWSAMVLRRIHFKTDPRPPFMSRSFGRTKLICCYRKYWWYGWNRKSCLSDLIAAIKTVHPFCQTLDINLIKRLKMVTWRQSDTTATEHSCFFHRYWDSLSSLTSGLAPVGASFSRVTAQMIESSADNVQICQHRRVPCEECVCGALGWGLLLWPQPQTWILS